MCRKVRRNETTDSDVNVGIKDAENDIIRTRGGRRPRRAFCHDFSIKLRELLCAGFN